MPDDQIMPLPFDITSPNYIQWYRERKPYRARMIWILGGLSETRLGTLRGTSRESPRDAKRLTLDDVVKLIETGDILKIKKVGEFLVRQHIEALFKHGIVTEKWYHSQMERVKHA